ncbi:hypothetical protein [Streptomyces sp. N2A]|uniref:hypothetical protein n=1 Tax=Streptomyces sp. N2A TaxID=3073936 RepID=UPI0028701D64|nr:hypothetical protein [Streptomyces sp. N2A]
MFATQSQGHRAEAQEAGGVGGQGLVQLPPCRSVPVVTGRVRTTVGAGTQRAVQDAHLVTEGGQVRRPFRVRAGGEEDRTLHARVVQRGQVEVQRVVDVAVGIDDHVLDALRDQLRALDQRSAELAAAREALRETLVGAEVRRGEERTAPPGERTTPPR